MDKSIIIDSERHGIRDSIRNLCDAFLARGGRKNDCRISTVGPKKINAVHPRLPGAARRSDRKGGGLRARRRVSARSNRSDPRDPSPKRTATRWCCLLDCYELSREREGLPSSSSFHLLPLLSVPFRTYSVARSTTLERHDGRPTGVRSILLRESSVPIYLAYPP